LFQSPSALQLFPTTQEEKYLQNRKKQDAESSEWLDNRRLDFVDPELHQLS
jgi:hypothetical protein